jgi:hypothetical protein
MFKRVRLIPAVALLLLAMLAQGAHAAILPMAFSNTAPGVAAFNGQVYVFYIRYPDNRIAYQTSTGGTSWSGESLIPVPPGTTPKSKLTAVSYNNLLYVFYSTASGSLLRYRYMNLAGAWSGEGTIVGANTDDGPGAAVFNGLLYVFWETAGSGSDHIGFVTVNTSNVQSAAATVPFGLTFKGPAATVFNNRLYLAYSGTNGSPGNGAPLYFGYMDANGNWIGDSQPTGSPRSSTGPTLAALGTEMWLIYLPKVVSSPNDLYFKQLDTLSVWTAENVLAPLTASDTGVSSVAFSGHIWVVGTLVSGTTPRAVQYSIL